MTSTKVVSGEVVHIGNPSQQDGTDGSCILDMLVIRAEDGTTTRVTEVVVNGSIRWLLHKGVQGRFELQYLVYPKPIGSYLRCFLTGIQTASAKVDARDSVRKFVRDSKGAVFHFLWFGLILMPAFGFGLLLWICALRLLMVQPPPLTSAIEG